MYSIPRSILGVLALTLMVFVAGCRKKAEMTRPVYQTISEAVYASVTVYPVQMYNVYATQPGIIEGLEVEEGDPIKGGQIIARMRAVDPQLNVENARLRYKLAQDAYKGRMTALDAMEEEIALKEIQARVDSQNYSRQTRLWEQNIGSKAALENAELKYTETLKSLDVLRTQYEQKARELQSAYAQADIALQQARVNLEEFTVTSRFDGCVYEVLKEEGERVMLQDPIAKIGLCDSFVLEMLVDEVDIARITPGQQVIVTLDAYPDEAFEARVTRIYPLKDLQTQTFTVEAQFRVPPPVLFAGLGGEANIVIAMRANVLVVPVEYVKDGNLVLTEQGEVPVETGLQSLAYIEILSGIDSSAVLLKPEYK